VKDAPDRRRTTITTPHTHDADRTQAARKFAIDAARLAAGTRCHNVVVLDVRGISPITDYLVVATGTSARQMSTVMAQVEELGQTTGFSCLPNAGYEGDTWLLCDMVDVVIHLFNGESRQFYDLDSLWGDAKRVEWKPADAQTTPA
jgi:ribosome-associated protein